MWKPRDTERRTHRWSPHRVDTAEATFSRHECPPHASCTVCASTTSSYDRSSFRLSTTTTPRPEIYARNDDRRRKRNGTDAIRKMYPRTRHWRGCYRYIGLVWNTNARFRGSSVRAYGRVTALSVWRASDWSACDYPLQPASVCVRWCLCATRQRGLDAWVLLVCCACVSATRYQPRVRSPRVKRSRRGRKSRTTGTHTHSCRYVSYAYRKS